MKYLWGLIGELLFWPAWPLLWLYLRYGGQRSRILVVCGDEVLLVRGWLGDKKYMLPGGGCKKGESMEVATVRELFEETGIVAAESSITKLGSRTHKEKGLRYKAQFFIVSLNEKPELKLPWHEILEARWVGLDEFENFDLSPETAYVIKRYRPPEQASLL